jgi:hypothetical protein
MRSACQLALHHRDLPQAGAPAAQLDRHRDRQQAAVAQVVERVLDQLPSRSWRSAFAASTGPQAAASATNSRSRSTWSITGSSTADMLFVSSTSKIRRSCWVSRQRRLHRSSGVSPAPADDDAPRHGRAHRESLRTLRRPRYVGRRRPRSTPSSAGEKPGPLIRGAARHPHPNASSNVGSSKEPTSSVEGVTGSSQLQGSVTAAGSRPVGPDRRRRWAR